MNVYINPKEEEPILLNSYHKIELRYTYKNMELPDSKKEVELIETQLKKDITRDMGGLYEQLYDVNYDILFDTQKNVWCCIVKLKSKAEVEVK